MDSNYLAGYYSEVHYFRIMTYDAMMSVSIHKTVLPRPCTFVALHINLCGITHAFEMFSLQSTRNSLKILKNFHVLVFNVLSVGETPLKTFNISGTVFRPNWLNSNREITSGGGKVQIIDFKG